MAEQDEFCNVSMSGVGFDGIAYGLSYKLRKTDAGRSKSKRPKQGKDCTVRAYATAFELSYDDAYEVLKNAGRKCSSGFKFSKWIERQQRISKLSFPAKKGEKRMNIAVFCQTHPSGVYICNVAKHVFAVIDGVVHDTAENGPERCVYSAWKVD